MSGRSRTTHRRRGGKPVAVQVVSITPRSKAAEIEQLVCESLYPGCSSVTFKGSDAATPAGSPSLLLADVLSTIQDAAQTPSPHLSPDPSAKTGALYAHSVQKPVAISSQTAASNSQGGGSSQNSLTNSTQAVMRELAHLVLQHSSEPPHTYKSLKDQPDWVRTLILDTVRKLAAADGETPANVQALLTK